MTPKELDKFRQLLNFCPPGPRIEFGVFRGHTLSIIEKHNDITIGVDSFEGMPEPSERDIKNGENPYPAGRLLANETYVKGIVKSSILIKGFVPNVLPSIPNLVYSFCHIDMDQYDSTLAALKWIWPKIIKNGVIICDDYIASRDWLAAGAINEFSKNVGMPNVFGKKAWWII